MEIQSQLVATYDSSCCKCDMTGHESQTLIKIHGPKLKSPISLGEARKNIISMFFGYPRFKTGMREFQNCVI